MRRIMAIVVSAALALTACAGDDDGARENPVRDGGGSAGRASGTAAGGAAAGGGSGAPAVDPRDGGLEVALGEWALTLEAAVIRPGRVTFEIHNRGTIGHGFEIEAEDGDSSGHGSGDGLKAETDVLHPGDSTRLTLDLAPGIYKVECLVDGHDDMGMEGFLEVREGAPLVRDRRTGGAAEDGRVGIVGFAFEPSELTVSAGTEVTWTNDDPAPHTVTAEDGSFDSGTIEPGGTFSVVVDAGGPVTYRCEIHPDMTGTISVR